MPSNPLRAMVKRIRDKDWYHVDLGKGNARDMQWQVMGLMTTLWWLFVWFLKWMYLW